MNPSSIVALSGAPIFAHSVVGVHLSELNEILQYLKNEHPIHIIHLNGSMLMALKKINEDDIPQMARDDYAKVAANLIAFHVSNLLLYRTKIPILINKEITDAMVDIADEGGMKTIYPTKKAA